MGNGKTLNINITYYFVVGDFDEILTRSTAKGYHLLDNFNFALASVGNLAPTIDKLHHAMTSCTVIKFLW